MNTETTTKAPFFPDVSFRLLGKKISTFFLKLLKKLGKLILFLHVCIVGIVILAVIVSHFHRARVFSNQITHTNGIWHHPDSETEFWLNYTTGKVKMDSWRKQKIAMQMVLLEESYVYEKKDTNRLQTLSPEGKYLYFLSIIKDSVPYRKEIHDFVWEYALKSGSPKIGLIFGNSFTKKRPYQENYNGIKNKMYINPFPYAIGEKIERKNPGIRSIMAEMVHANQYFTDGTRSVLRLAWDGYRTLIRWPFSGKSFIDTYERTYHEKGSIEYTAHKEIEPKIIKELERLEKNN